MMKCLLQCLMAMVLLNSSSSSVPSSKGKDSRSVTRASGDRSAKQFGFWLPWITIARFDNAPCLAADGRSTGICYSAQECRRRAGVSAGECAQGYGRCCVNEKSCDLEISTNNTYFVNPSYPATDSGSLACKLIVHRMPDENICQLRLDFEEFVLAGPDLYAASAGQCNTDRMLILGIRGETPPQLCGINSGQHMYVDVDGDPTPTELDIITFGEQFDRRWRIKVAQIPCGVQTAPNGCLQYFRGLQGHVKSFNFDGESVHLADHRYSVCVATEPSFCVIEWSAVQGGDDYNSFSISDTYPKSMPSVGGTDVPDPRHRTTDTQEDFVPPTCSGAEGYADYVSIPCGGPDAVRAFTLLGSGGADIIGCAHKFCGQALNSLNGAVGNNPVSSSAKPFILSVNFDAGESQDGGDGGLQNRGFHLMWVQKPCQSQMRREDLPNGGVDVSIVGQYRPIFPHHRMYPFLLDSYNSYILPNKQESIIK